MNPTSDKLIRIATRGSALALAQANLIAGQCRAAFPGLSFEIRIIKTTGDNLQALSLSQADPSLPKGLFTKELESALLNQEADLAVHSLKDLPTELPDGLTLAAVPQRADVRDVLVQRKADLGGLLAGLRSLSRAATVATGSVRRQAQLLALRPDVKVAAIRGNVGTRLRKLAENAGADALILAAAGLERLHIQIEADGTLRGESVPDGLVASCLSLEEMLPCVGQGALGIEARAKDDRVLAICERLDDLATRRCVTAERAFLRGMGGGCLSPVAAYAEVAGGQLRLRAVYFATGAVRSGDRRGLIDDAEALGQQLALELKGS